MNTIAGLLALLDHVVSGVFSLQGLMIVGLLAVAGFVRGWWDARNHDRSEG